MDQAIQLQFLDLDDVDKNVQDYVKSLLDSSGRSPRLELPWVQPEAAPQQWDHNTHYEEEDDGGGGGMGGEMYPVQVAAVQTTVPAQLYLGMSPVTGSPYLSGPPPPGAALYIPYPAPAAAGGPAPEERARRPHHHPPPAPRGSKSSPTKRGVPPPGGDLHPQHRPHQPPPTGGYPSPPGGGTGYPPPTAPPNPPYPIQLVSPTGYHPYIAQPPMAPSPAGHPLYMAAPPSTPMVFYPSGYTQVFPSPHHVPTAEDYEKEPPPQPAATSFVQETPLVTENNIQHTVEPVKPVFVEKPPSLPINAIKTTAPPPHVSVKKPKPPPVTAVAAAAAPQVAESVTTVVETSPVTTSVTTVSAQEVVAPSPAPPTQITPAPVAAAPPPVASAPAESKSWAALFKPASSGGSGGPPPGGATAWPTGRKPPMSAVAVTRPLETRSTVGGQATAPRPSPAPPAPLSQSDSEEDPLHRRLAECLSTYQLEHKAPVLSPRGLYNPSNYCYINATLQALLACPPFYNLIRAIAAVKDACGPLPSGAAAPSSTSPRPSLRTPIIDSMVQFIKEFSVAPANRSGRKEKSLWKQEKQEELDVPVGAPFEPSYVYRMLHALRNEHAFQVEGRQEDAEEFLSLLLNGLNDEMVELVKLVGEKTETGLVNGDLMANGESHLEDNSDWKEVSKGQKSGRITRRAELAKTPLSDIFRGQLRSRLQRSCHEESTDSVQPFFTLQLDIESSDSVTEALEKYLGGREPVEGGGAGGRGSGATGGGGSSGSSSVAPPLPEMWHQHSLEELPLVLILHLKCFLFSQQTSAVKISKPLDFPIDLKIDPKFVSNKNKCSVKMRLYKLFAGILKPKHYGDEYINRKGRPTLNVLATCNAKEKFTLVDLDPCTLCWDMEKFTVVYHDGTEASKGHYLTDTYHVGSGGWLRYDDSVVRAVSETVLLRPRPPRVPYLLYYRRADTISGGGGAR